MQLSDGVQLQARSGDLARSPEPAGLRGGENNQAGCAGAPGAAASALRNQRMACEVWRGVARRRLSCRVEPAPALLPRAVRRWFANTHAEGLAALGTAAEGWRFCRQLRPTERARFCLRTGTEILPRRRYRHSHAAFASFEPIPVSRA